jgi:predicted site-specific integrase-resolvase
MRSRRLNTRQNLTPAEVAEILGRNLASIYLYLKTGALKAEDVNAAGKRPTYRIAPEEVQRFIKERKSERFSLVRRGGGCAQK